MLMRWTRRPIKMYGGGGSRERSFNSERGARSSSDANHKEELYVQHGSTDDDDRIHVKLADPCKEDVNYIVTVEEGTI